MLGTVVLAGAAFYVDGIIKSTDLGDEIGRTRVNPTLSFETSEDRINALGSQRSIEISKALFSFTVALASGGLIYSARRKRQSA